MGLFILHSKGAKGSYQSTDCPLGRAGTTQLRVEPAGALPPVPLLVLGMYGTEQALAPPCTAAAVPKGLIPRNTFSLLCGCLVAIF